MERAERLENGGREVLERCQEALGRAFADSGLLFEALVHKSYANENSVPVDNERMEFLGDAVLDVAVSDRLMRRFPESREGALSKLRSSLVNESALAAAARRVGLGAFLFLGKGEEASGGREKDSILADAFEAVLGAIYLDAGLEAAYAFVDRTVGAEIERLSGGTPDRDYKTQLQEVVQRRFGVTPRYGVVESEGPDHDRTFRVEIAIQGAVWGSGAGKSKKGAEQAAAAVALAALQASPEPGAPGPDGSEDGE